MSIERINPDDVYPPFNNNYTQVVRTTGSTQLHLAGMVPVTTDHELVGEGNMRLQLEAVVDNIDRALRAVGAGPEHIARINIFVTDVDRFREVGAAILQPYFAGNLPASTLVGVTRLADPRYLVEIEITAVVD